MKKIILLLTAVILAANLSNAQDNENDFREKLILGPKIGLNLSNVYDAQGDQFKADSKFGLVLGGFLSIPIGKYLGLQPEMLFSQKGFKGTGTILGYDYTFNRTTNYIDVPILIQLKPSPLLTLMVGPQYSYLIKQTDVYGNTTQEQEFKNENIRKNILCFLGGADFNLKHVTLGARVGWDVTNNNGDGTSTTPRYKNVWYQGTVGFRFY